MLILRKLNILGKKYPYKEQYEKRILSINNYIALEKAKRESKALEMYLFISSQIALHSSTIPPMTGMLLAKNKKGKKTKAHICHQTNMPKMLI